MTLTQQQQEDEYLAAVCLCGSALCRSSFLHFAGYEQFHRILTRNYGPARRFASLMHAAIGAFGVRRWCFSFLVDKSCVRSIPFHSTQQTPPPHMHTSLTNPSFLRPTYATTCRFCAGSQVSDSDRETLAKHGIKRAAFQVC
jgi:hypothetical protein